MRWHTKLLLAAAGLVLLGPGALSAEVLDVLDCRAGTVNLLHGSKELTMLSLELTGVYRTRNDNKAWHAATTRCIGLNRIKDGKRVANGYRKSRDAGGDYAFVEWSSTSLEGGTWAYLGGTGKWKDITGSGDWRYATRAAPIEPGTFQGCIIITGNYTVGG